jgi:hypothetical protein
MLSVAAILASGLMYWQDPEPARPTPTADRNSPWAVSASLDQRLKVTQDHNRALRHIAQEVVAGRLTLPEAAARYRDLNAANPDFDYRTFERGFAGANEEERCCRQVIARVEAELANDPERARDLKCQLEAVLETCRN